MPVKSPPSTRTKSRKPTYAAMRASYVDPILDLHGLNKAQALFELEKFLDRSLLLGHSRLKIIHGQGKGTLRSAVRAYLNDHPLVKGVTCSIHGMSGMTIVEI